MSRPTIPLRHIRIHGHEVGFRSAGSGDAVLLIHGMAGSSRTWRDVMPALAERYMVIAPDLLGHGESAKPMGDYSLGAHANGIRDLLIALGVRNCTVVGQSLGGGVAMQLAYQHPDIADRLVLIGSGGLGREVNPILRLFTLPGTEYLMPILFPAFTRDAGDKLSRTLHRRGIRWPHLDEIWRAYSSLTEPENRKAFVRTLRAVIDPGGQAISAIDRLYLTAALPTLIMWGDRDPVIPVAHAYAAHEAMPGSRLHIFPGVGHFPHVEVPELVTEHLLDFLAGTDAHDDSLASFTSMLMEQALASAS